MTIDLQPHPSIAAKVRPANVGGSVEAIVETRADGSTIMRSAEALADRPERMTDRLEHWAAQAPDRTLIARRTDAGAGDWRRIGYAQMLDSAQRMAESLARRGLCAERPVVVLSGNGLDHMVLAMGALWAGVPYVPVSVPYSLMSTDFVKLRHILALARPGLVYAESPAFARAIEATVPPDCEVVLGEGGLPGRNVTRFDELLAVAPGAAGDAAHRAVTSRTIAKILFTSGSTALPKGVINTHGMWCSSQQMLRQCMVFLTEEPPLIVDWLPWNHTFGGNYNFGSALYNGGSYYIDDGKPAPVAIEATLRNLRELSPTVYSNVPKGFEEIVHAMDADTGLRDNLFRRLKAFMFAGAGLSQAVWDRLDAHAVAATGERIRVITGIGMTETGPSGTLTVGPSARSGQLGLPQPGLLLKLVPSGEKMELRIKGPTVFPGYWHSPEQTAAAFDEEGYFRTGDAVRAIDSSLQAGLAFDGRITEDFKLSTGTFVSVGPMRARVILDGDPLVQDVVVAGINEDEVGLLVFPRLDDCRQLAGLGLDAAAAEVLRHGQVREAFQALLDRLWRAGTGSANRPARLLLLADPPSLDGELTDKGSVNQRSVLSRRAADVAALYAARRGNPEVLFPTPAN